MKASLFVIIISTWLAVCRGGDWPNFRGPDYNGISQEQIPSSLPEELPILWKQNVGIGFSTVAVKDGRVLTMGNSNNKDTVTCLDVDTGKPVWEYTYDCELDPLYYEGGPGGTPTIHDGSVYTLSKKGHAYRFDLETGKVIWQRDLVADYGFKLPEWSFASSPFVHGDRVIHNAGRSGVALSLETGRTLWKSSPEPSGYATVVPFGKSHLLFSSKAVIALDITNGTPLWEFPWKSGRDVNAADPIALGDRILVSSASGSSLLDLSDGQPRELWKQHDMKWYFNTGVVIGEHVYSIHGTTHRPTELMCADLATGKIIWSEENYGSGGLKAAGKVVIVFDNGTLTLFEASPEKFQLIHRQKILEGKCWTSPVLANGRIYCRNAVGELACVGVNSLE